MGWVLVTNDDGVDSPALVPFARALAERHAVRVVVPDRERSWVAKAITRYEPVSVGRSEREGIEVWTCSGYPADAVQLGIHALFDEPPAMVVAGVNLGYNHGAGFLMSSGTVGAAVEAWVSGIPAVAFSTGTTVDWPAWRRRVESSEAGPGWSRLSKVCAGLLDEVTGSGLLGHADVVSVNLPFDATPSTPRRVTSIARVGYDRLFRQEAVDRFRHEFGGGLLEFAGLEGTDVDAARRGWVSITPVRLPQAAEVPASITESLEADRG
ncbi:MAG: 5'/3'-nucleotidase SurE [Acidimicrobiia bacterium]|jgi:5'-nucleotidase